LCVGRRERVCVLLLGECAGKVKKSYNQYGDEYQTVETFAVENEQKGSACVSMHAMSAAAPEVVPVRMPAAATAAAAPEAVPARVPAAARAAAASVPGASGPVPSVARKVAAFPAPIADVLPDEVLEKLYSEEPLKSVDWTETKRQRTPDEVRKLMTFLSRRKEVLSDGKLDYWNDPVPHHNVTCHVRTTVENPRIVSAPMRVSPMERGEQQKHVTELLEQGIIEPSCAPWCSNAVFVKRNGKTRMAVDYRQLNRVTVKDVYPMPRIQDLVDNLKGTKWFTSLDCVQAFHQIPMADERAMDLTTFRGPSGGLYRFRYMPFGLQNAMAVWSRFLESIMADHHYKLVLCYADDCLVYTKEETVDEHIRDVGLVLDRLQIYGVKVKASKIKLGVKHLGHLGVILHENGVTPNKEKTKAITDLPLPRTLRQLRRTLGIFAYYRKFIPRFSEIAAPLYEQTKKGVVNPKASGKSIILTEESKVAFDKLKETITTTPVMLFFPDWELPFEIHCDASKEAVAAVLYQIVDGKERVIMYASRTLNVLERKYQTYEQECLAVVWAVELFRQYIRNQRTIVRTDCSALQWLKTRDSNSRILRWIMRIQEFDLDIQHRKGKKSGDVDGLTRDSVQSTCPYGEEPIDPLYEGPDVLVMTTRAEAKKGGEVVEPFTKQWERPAQAKRWKASEPAAASSVPTTTSPPIAPTSTTTASTKATSSPAAEDEGLDGKHGGDDEPAPEGPIPIKKGFFPCSEDHEAQSTEEWLRCQKDPDSKLMKRAREDMKANARTPYYLKGELVCVKGAKGDRTVVPECLRAYVLRMHHNMELAAHQGHKRMINQITSYFF
jgi:hypothetical protein